jgi:nucleoside-diphosphate-sugar epimerase
VELDLVDLTGEQLAEFQVDAIVHLAGQPGVRGSWGSQFDSYTHANVEATQRLLEVVKGLERRPRFVYASSSSIYGQAESYPTDETALPQPFSPYGVTKLAGEHLVNLYRANFRLDTVAFRFFTVYGPGQRPDMAFTRFLRAAHEGSPITIYGDGKQIRDFTFVGDIVDALILAVNADGDLPSVMNLSGGSSVSVNEVLETIREITGCELNVGYLDAVLGDVYRTGGSNDLARRALGWEPRRTLREGLTEQWQWIQDAGTL